MKNFILIFCILGMGKISVAQTNTFPSSGSTGIGTTSPAAKLHVVNSTGSNGDFNGYPGYTTGDIWPNNKTPETIFERPYTSTSTGGQYTYRGGIGLGYGVGIYSVNPNPAGSPFYGDIRFHTTYWNGSGYVNTDRMIIDQGGNVSVGTSSGPEKLTVSGGRVYAAGTGTSSGFTWANWNTYQDASDNLITRYGTTEVFKYASNGTATFAAPTRFNDNVAIGTTDPQGYKLAVNGNMIAESVKVKLHANWPDHVFSKSYKLPDLKETEKFINENSHLPEIPSAVEVEKDGINLGEMNSKLLQKIEELTLYLIDQNKEIKELKSEINQLKSKP